MLPVAGADEELDLGEERLKVRDVWHGELHESRQEEEEKEISKEKNNNIWGSKAFDFPADGQQRDLVPELVEPVLICNYVYTQH